MYFCWLNFNSVKMQVFLWTCIKKATLKKDSLIKSQNIKTFITVCWTKKLTKRTIQQITDEINLILKISVIGGVGHSSVVECSWCSRSSDQTHLFGPSSYFLFQPVFHKDHCMWYPVCGMVHMKDPLLLIRKSSPWSGSSGFLLIIFVVIKHMSPVI